MRDSGGGRQVRSVLRQTTGAAHERLHQAPHFVAIANQQLEIEGYTNLLRRIATFHFTVAEGLEFNLSRTQRLKTDLEVLRCPAPKPLQWEFPVSTPARLGWSYVVEGSSLGGQVIYKKLDYLFASSTAGRLFFRGSSSDARRWQALCRELEAQGQEADDLDEMIAGAAAAFALFEQVVVPSKQHT